MSSGKVYARVLFKTVILLCVLSLVVYVVIVGSGIVFLISLFVFTVVLISAVSPRYGQPAVAVGVDVRRPPSRDPPTD